MTIDIQYASDLHIEFPANKKFLKQNPITPTAAILVLAGDIMPFAVMDQHQDFLNYLADHFETTYWLPGNHEYYKFDISEKCGQLHERIRSNVFLVNNVALQYGATKLLFTSLWSKISPYNQWQIERSLNDFHLIKYKGFRFSVEHYNRLHEESFAFLQTEMIKVAEEKLAVFTHHCPTFLNYPEQYKGDILNEAFAVELFQMIENSGVAAWVYGHHHNNVPEFCIGTTKLLTNQLGYVQKNEQTGYRRDKIISI